MTPALLLGLVLVGCGERADPRFGVHGSGGVDADGDGWAAGTGVRGDCNDGDATVYPGADEICDGFDQDCDGIVDEDAVDADTWYSDADGDGYGENPGTRSCVELSGAVDVGGDCDDGDAAVGPGTVEVCDNQDNDCDGVTDDGLLGSGPACFASSCAAVGADRVDATDGLYWVDVDGSAAGELLYCELSTDGGGWLLVAISADDGDDRWTWAGRDFWEGRGETFGDPVRPGGDYRSSALPRAPLTDILAVHEPSGVWAAYHKVGDGNGTLADLVADTGERVCWGASDGWELAAGTLSVLDGLCSSRLYFNAAERDAGGTCPGGVLAQDTHGPAWSIDAGQGCDLDAPALSGFGADASAPSTERGGRGFGGAQGLNTGDPGSGENRIMLFVR